MEKMPIFIFVDVVGSNLAIAVPIIVLLLALLVVYLVCMTRAVIEMLHYRVSSVLLTFGFLALIPFPLLILWGIIILIIWRYHRSDLQSHSGEQSTEAAT